MKVLLLFPTTFNDEYIIQQSPDRTYAILHPSLMTRWDYNPLAVTHRLSVAKGLTRVDSVILPNDYASFVAMMMEEHVGSDTIICPFVPDDDVLDDVKMFGGLIIPSLSFCLHVDDYATVYGDDRPTLKTTMTATRGKTSLDFGPSTDVDNRDHLPDHHTPLNHDGVAMTRKDALRSLDDFFHHRFSSFAQYEDAIAPNDPFIYHSNISSSLNIGLLTIADITTRLSKIHIGGPARNNAEAFFRQIFGWREYMLAIWWYGPRTTKEKIGDWRDFMAGRLSAHYIRQPSPSKTTVDDLIAVPGIVGIETKRARDIGYAHHIVRLMVIGNYLYLINASPIDAVNIFMSLTIDAYPWVMYGNVVYMSMHTFGRVYTRKPYYSSGAYLRRMSCDEYRHDREFTRAIDDAYSKFRGTKKD